MRAASCCPPAPFVYKGKDPLLRDSIKPLVGWNNILFIETMPSIPFCVSLVAVFLLNPTCIFYYSAVPGR